MTQRPRPLSGTVLALILGILGAAAVVNAFALGQLGSLPSGASARTQAMVAVIQSAPFRTLVALYGVLAIASAVGMWRMRRWMLLAVTGWVLVVVLLFGYLVVSGFGGLGRGSVVSLIPLMVPVGLLLGAFWLYVRRLAREPAV